MADLDTSLTIAVKTGKVLFGSNSTLNSAMSGKFQLVVAASNCPNKVRADLEHYCKISKIPFLVYPKTGLELGRLCGKPFVVSALAIRDPGDSDIVKRVEEGNV
ncbi:50S ribosomal protein L30e [Candidatus Bathyarchaeota archaeon]|nr:50S ribosomal protein L30e [Candidatus Bathyarchaeota archaeon]